MIADQPLIVYNKDGKSKIATKQKADKLADEWAEKHKRKEGEKISLSDFFSNGEQLNRKNIWQD